MDRINRWLLAASNSWVIVLLISLNAAALQILVVLQVQFELAAGVAPFDMQTDLTRALIAEQLPLYAGEALSAYYRFAAFDFVFALVAGITSCALITMLLRVNSWSVTQRLLHWGAPAIFLLVVLWDWLETLALLALVTMGASPTLITAALAFKRLKLIWLAASGGAIVLGFAAWGIHAIQRSIRKPDAPQKV